MLANLLNANCAQEIWTIPRDTYIKCKRTDSILMAVIFSAIAVVLTLIMLKINNSRKNNPDPEKRKPLPLWSWAVVIGLPLLMWISVPFSNRVAGNKWDQTHIAGDALMSKTGMTAKEYAQYMQAEKLKEIEAAALRQNPAYRSSYSRPGYPAQPSTPESGLGKFVGGLLSGLKL